MTKYYRVLKDTFMWNKDAIISNQGGGYRSLEDFMNHVELNTEYISEHIIENKDNSEFFERVYLRGKLESMVFETAERMKELIKKGFKTK